MVQDFSTRFLIRNNAICSVGAFSVTPSTYTGCFILIAAGKYLEKYGNYEKMFRTKVVWFRGGHEIVTLV